MNIIVFHFLFLSLVGGSISFCLAPFWNHRCTKAEILCLIVGDTSISTLRPRIRTSREVGPPLTNKISTKNTRIEMMRIITTCITYHETKRSFHSMFREECRR